MSYESPNHQLIQLLTRHHRRIFSYIHALVPNRHDAEDILQDTSSVICRKFEEFEPGTDFVAWACQIAWWRVRAARQKFARSKVTFDERVLEAVSRTAISMSAELDFRHDALEHCLHKLHPRDRELIMGCYEPEGGVKEAALRSGRSMAAAYKALGRIRKLLFDCVTLQLNPEPAHGHE
ncbi:MAG: sigma-70 family RNA polymerase sigma factor [Luteolibacter sp.]